MIRFVSVALQGFRSFEADQVFKFPPMSSGFFLVTGENKVEPDLGANACLAGDTLIDCPRDLVKYPKGIPIKDLVGQQPWVYAWKDGQIVVRKAERVWLTKKGARTVRVKLRSHQNCNRHYLPPLELVGTPDHPVLLSDCKTWRPLGKLRKGDRLCSLYRSQNGRTDIRWTGPRTARYGPPSHGTAKGEYLFVCEQVHGARPSDEHEAHHKNGRKLDHSPDNLEWKVSAEHTRDHHLGKVNSASTRQRMAEAQRKRFVVSGGMSEAHKSNLSESGKAYFAAGGKHGMLGRKHTEDARARMSAAQRKRHALGLPNNFAGKRHSEATRKHLSEIRRGKQLSEEHKARIAAGVTRSRAALNHVVVRVDPGTSQDVYDMRVPDADSFVANGVVVHNCGKSSIWDAVSWCLYGKTIRGLRGKDVANRKREHLTSVCVEFKRGRAFYAITRTYDPNTLVIDEEGKDPRPIPQEELDQLLGVRYEGFIAACIVGQFNQLFFDLSPTEKLAQLSNFLDLDVWTKAAERAREALKEHQSSLQTKEHQLAQVGGRREGIDTALAQAKKQHSEFERERDSQVQSLRLKIAEAERHEEKAEQAQRKATKICDELEQKNNEAKQALLQLDSQRNDQRAKTIRLRSEAEHAENAESELVAEIDRVQALKGACPTCFAEVTRDHKHRVVEELNDKLEERKSTRDDIDDRHEKAKAKLASLEEQLSAASRNLDAYTATLAELAGKRDRATRALGEAQRDRSLAQQRLEEARSRANPYGAQAERLEEELQSLETQEARLDSDLRQLRKESAGFEYWAGRFKDVRLWVVEQALTELEVHINNALEELGLYGYRITFDIERPKADGSGVIRGFQVLINEPGNPDPIPWEAWSGGETQRLRLAGTVGIQDLVCARTGFSSSIEVWDEPTAHLSQEGIDDLLTLLANRSRQRNRQLWLVDHRALNAGDFDDELRIVKTPEGSQIRYKPARAAPGHPPRKRERVRAKEQ